MTDKAAATATTPTESPSSTPSPAPATSATQEGTHNFKRIHFSRPTFCNVCRAFLFGISKQGSTCLTCGICVHDRCVVQAQTPGVVACKRGWSAAATSAPPEHHWVEGNVHMLPDRVGCTCVVCGTAAGSITSLADWRCTWCSAIAHSSCKERVPPGCSYGILGSLIAPPSLVVRAASGRFVLELPPDPAPDSAPAPPASALIPVAPASPAPPFPLLCFVNRKSGGQQGKRVLAKLRGLLNPVQVFDLMDGGPDPGFDFVSAYGTDFRVLACGGDGTVGWVLEGLRRRNLHPPVGILPLGTGNDLARTLGWGGGYTGGDLEPFLIDVARAPTVQVDRWLLRTAEFDPKTGIRRDPTDRVVNNYWSIGIDAAVALDFHTRRERDPEAFSSRVGNKLLYIRLGATELFSPDNSLGSSVRLEVDDAEVRLPAMQGLVVLNLPSCYGGRNLWGNSFSDFERDRGFVPVATNDGILEVVSIKNAFDLGQISSRISLPEKIAQGRRIRITFLTSAAFPCQFDGEPYLQQPAVIELSLLEKANMLLKTPPVDE